MTIWGDFQYFGGMWYNYYNVAVAHTVESTNVNRSTFPLRLFTTCSQLRRFGTPSASKLAALGLKVETFPRRERWVAFRARGAESDD